MPTPLIAVTTSEVRRSASIVPTPQGEPPQHEMALGMRYTDAITAGGGLPVVVPPLDQKAIDQLLGQVAGVCVSGGPDLDPESYGQRRHEAAGPMEPEIDRFELALVRAADARRLPILAICRGMQLLNVARGGTLHQHLPDLVGDRIAHRQTESGHRPTHWVAVQQDSRLRDLLGLSRTKVNSFHHQAVAELGDSLRITSRASDGTVEGIEALDREFVLGVQWHAECLVHRASEAALFTAFVASAQRYAEAGERFARAA
jgi:putative glutamine amidotransferase